MAFYTTGSKNPVLWKSHVFPCHPLCSPVGPYGQPLHTFNHLSATVHIPCVPLQDLVIPCKPLCFRYMPLKYPVRFLTVNNRLFHYLISILFSKFSYLKHMFIVWAIIQFLHSTALTHKTHCYRNSRNNMFN